jgi:tRNA(Ile2) C34 agmatinyltransferase TiaS
MDWALSLSPLTYALIVLAILVLFGAYKRRYQRCPHCRRLVPRARRGWLRCKTCGRQYHRSVWLRR